MWIDGEVTCFAPFHNVNCPQGFLYFNNKVNQFFKIIFWNKKDKTNVLKCTVATNGYVVNTNKNPIKYNILTVVKIWGDKTQYSQKLFFKSI